MKRKWESQDYREGKLNKAREINCYWLTFLSSDYIGEEEGRGGPSLIIEASTPMFTEEANTRPPPHSLVRPVPSSVSQLGC